MQKVYLLLRNNKQTGPYSFEELLQLHLKPHDLIWVEGKSYGWRYPTEVETLKSYFTIPEVPQPQATSFSPVEPASDAPVLPVQPKNIFVRMPVNGSQRSQPETKPVDPIEQKAEELRKRVQAFTPQQEPIKTNYARDLQDAEEEYTRWVYQKKTKKKSLINKKSTAVTTICLLLFFGGWYGVKFFSSVPPVAERIILPSSEEKGEPSTINETQAKENNRIEGDVVSSTTLPGKPVKEKIKVQGSTKEIVSEKQESVTGIETTQNETAEKNTDNAISEEKVPEVIAETPAENKKTLKEKISDLFRKRKGDESAAQSEPKSSGNDNERKATHRDDEDETIPALVDVSNEVELKTNKIADSWMMGVKNLKLTLYNRSNITIQSAKVEVLYYSEQNNLLEKKVLSYANIPPKKSQTIGAPDQRLADHIEYKVISATGIENAYAKQ